MPPVRSRTAGGRGVFLAGGFMSDSGNNAFIALCLGLTAAVTLGWLGVVGYGVWHFLFG